MICSLGCQCNRSLLTYIVVRTQIKMDLGSLAYSLRQRLIAGILLIKTHSLGKNATMMIRLAL